MAVSEHLQSRFPALAGKLKKKRLATLPTPVRESSYMHNGRVHSIWIKQDNLSGKPYGGNKVRKLEYLLQAVIDKQRSRVATFGAVGSHHALATAFYAQKLGLGCTVLLSHQTRVTSIPAILNTHLELGSEIVRYGGAYRDRVGTLRKFVQGRNAWLIPAGGSSWLGTVGFINAGLELAAQISAKQLPMPDRLYVATGTMSTVAGLALGLALAKLPIEIHAVRVSHKAIANPAVLKRLMRKTVAMLTRLDASFPHEIAAHTCIVLRDEYFSAGYANSNPVIEAAIDVARDQLALSLESTYTGKAMAAMLGDLDASGKKESRSLFWNTYHSAPLLASSERPSGSTKLPDEFLRYFE